MQFDHYTYRVVNRGGWTFNEISCVDKLVGRPSTVARIVNLVWPTAVHFITLTFYLCRTKLTTPCDNRNVRVSSKVPEKYPYSRIIQCRSTEATTRKAARSVQPFQWNTGLCRTDVRMDRQRATGLA